MDTILDIHKKVYEYEQRMLEREYDQKLKLAENETKISLKQKYLKEAEKAQKEYEKHNKDSRMKEYKRKSAKLAKNLTSADFFSYRSKNETFNLDEGVIYFSLIKLASTHNSIVSKWCNDGIDNFDSKKIVELYECIKNDIYQTLGIENFGIYPVIDQWLQVLDACLDYSNSKRICAIAENLEKFRKEALPTNYQIITGLVYTDSEGKNSYITEPDSSNLPKEVDPWNYQDFKKEEQFLAGIEKIFELYTDAVRKESRRLLETALVNRKCYYNVVEPYEHEFIGKHVDPEYEHYKAALIQYVRSNNPTVQEILQEKGYTIEYAEKLLSFIGFP